MKNIENLVRKNIKQIKPYSSARDEYNNATDAMIFIDANENPFQNEVNRYPDPQQRKVKQQLSKIKNIPIQNILLGNGSDEVLDLIFRVFCEPNKDNVLLLPPTYGMYEVLANINAIDVIKIELNNAFEPQVEKIIAAQNNNSKLLFICSPNNPTANSFNALKVEKLIKEFAGIVVIDEAYIDFSEQESWLSRLQEFPNLIVTQTLSKAYGLAGIRIGTCYASSKIIAILNSIKPPYNVNTLSQKVALKKLKNSKEISNQIKEILTQRSVLEKQLASITWVDTIYPSDANFLLVKVDDATKRYKQLIKKGIVVRNRTNQPLCNNCLRFSIGTATENNKLISILKKI